MLAAKTTASLIKQSLPLPFSGSNSIGRGLIHQRPPVTQYKAHATAVAPVWCLITMESADFKSAPICTDLRTENEDENQKPAASIYDVADRCFDVFEHLVLAVDEDCSPDQTFPTFGPASSDEPSRDIKGLRNNFAFWIDYTGALAPIGASLDDRLQGHDEIKEMVMELLEMVDRNLHRRMLYLLYDPARYGGSLASLLRTVEQSKGEKPTFLNTESQSRLSAIDSALDRLHFLAKAIRKASAKRQEQNLFNFVSDEDKFFHDVAISYVKRKCPNARPSLREHMGDIIAGRRRALLQKHRHARKLRTRRAPKPSPAPKPEQRLTTSVEKDAAGLLNPGGTSHVLSSVAGSKATQASKMDRRTALQHIRQKPALSIRSSASSQQGISMSAEYPDPPQVKPREAHVQCPFCLEPLLAVELRKGTKNEYWK